MRWNGTGDSLVEENSTNQTFLDQNRIPIVASGKYIKKQQTEIFQKPNI